ncbi:MAG: zinc ribbon domain-containing protein [Planctomycetaceae bacterium]
MRVQTSDNTAVLPRRRGKSKGKNFKYDGPVAVIKLELDTADTAALHRLAAQQEGVFRLRRALQREARTKCRAYWAAFHERGKAKGSPKQVRARLGLSRTGFEAAAKAHVEDSKWMRHHITKAQALHVADEVWESAARNLFTDDSGNRHGTPKVGSWWDFGRVPGRAKSHTKAAPSWETYRLVGTLDGHLNTYRHPGLAAEVTTAEQAAALPLKTSILKQPRRLRAPTKPSPGSWWDHDGPLAMIFTGLPKGDLVLPIRLPQGAGQWAHLNHFLADPTCWHKIDLVRVQDRHAVGGWRYYAHLLVHKRGYESAATKQRRAQVPTDRRAGLDGNVSNLSVASIPEGDPTGLLVEQITVTQKQRQAAERAAAKARRRARALDRSRRNNNAAQYEPSKRQRDRTERRAKSGLHPITVENLGGGRVSRPDGKPKRAYRKDTLSETYRRTRADHATASRANSQAKHARAKDLAARIVAVHGNQFVGEDCNITSWTRLWGKGIHLFSPGMLIDAVAQECAATGGQYRKASTHTTAMSQHCPCGARVTKTLADRIHNCAECGLRMDRDVISAILGVCVDFTDPKDPATARVNYELAQAIRLELAAQQEAQVQSTSTSPHHHPGEPWVWAGSHIVAVPHKWEVPPAGQRNHTPAYTRTEQPPAVRRGNSQKNKPKPGLVDA